jgi:hypothetical protein
MLLIYCLAEEQLVALEVPCYIELVKYSVLLPLVADGLYQPNYVFRPLPYLVRRPLANTIEVSIKILTGSHIEVHCISTNTTCQPHKLLSWK